MSEKRKKNKELVVKLVPSYASEVFRFASYLPELGTDLVSGLSGLNVDNFAHVACVCFLSLPGLNVGATKRTAPAMREHKHKRKKQNKTLSKWQSQSES